MAAISIISVIANIFLNYFLISRYGLNGAASANLISYIIFALLTYAVLEYNIRKLKNHSPSEKSDPVRNTSA